ncbi:extracellular solute-binding protein [Aestuariirhabdus litorea]|uniref:ABC transporter substrate-binding protein n=1 Tax=Aestuariirhabdus litorea TaxID=2528527 RepID=A0A3P3VT88_9GAMM|nr:extracellular solute-binding protein [Aestuariirhabdus litorea]RRJ84896.1 ABC transporter substrate-binding protein [Aestuariirhabdus litorea]RWW98122.1 ABC transporter substrate-binding protein [Endozoicomonadaceae bacterium GTF-13]
MRLTVIIQALLGAVLSINALLLSASELPKVHNSHGIAMHGSPKYAQGFTHFEYANPEAPKGGLLRLAVISSGGFDSLNPFIVKGISAAGIGYLGSSYLYESLTSRSNDEAFTEYGRIAERIEWPDDRSWVTFHLNPKARFHDGEPITAEDVSYTFELLTTQGHPLYRTYYKNVKQVSVIDTRTIRFDFEAGDNRELVLIVGQMPILPKHYWQERDFNSTGLEPPLGSGPYRIKSVDAGRSISYERVKDYWGADLPINRGHYNFDEIRFDYYRDDTVAIEALRAGEYDYREENSARNWATLYEGKPFEQQLMVKEALPNSNPTGMQGFVYNTRRELFSDPRVREALAYAFDFEWTNRNLFYSAYTRTESYFSNSELAARGLPSEEELELLNPYRDQLPERVFSEAYHPPKTAGDGNIRRNLGIAMRLLKEAGWEIRNKQLTHSATGKTFTFEMLLTSQAFERVVLPFKKNLERLGITMEVRMVDTQQYIQRVRSFDFDMIVGGFGQSSSPGNEQRDFWHSSQADHQGSRNQIGIQNPVIDGLIDTLIAAGSREELITATRALDRVLLWNFYVIPNWHITSDRIIYWNKFGRPQQLPEYGVSLDTWWYDASKAARINNPQTNSTN